MRKRVDWCAGESGFTRWGPRWGLERKTLELGAWRVELEVRLAGALLNYPRIGMLRADECGLTPELFECDDARLIYNAMRCCQAHGMLEDKPRVLVMVKVALKWGGYWDDRVAAHERGFFWSDLNLVDVACTGEFDVRLYATQLIELDNAIRQARKLWQQMTELLDGVGYVRALDGRCRNEPWNSMQ